MIFQTLVDQARALIERLHASARHVRDEVPEADKIRLSELEAWDSASNGIVELVFGPRSREAARWRALAERRSVLAGEAMRKDIKRGEFFGLIDYFHLAVGMLIEFEARYQLEMAASAQVGTPAAAPEPVPAAAPGPAALVPTNGLPTYAPAPAARAAEPAEPPPVVRPLSGRWELTIVVDPETYHWLSEVAALREPGGANDAAIARLAATVLDRVASNTRVDRRG